MPFECQSCPKKFKTYAAGRQHATDKGHRYDWCLCGICQKPFANAEARDRHRALEHATTTKTQVPSSKASAPQHQHRCPSCSLSFASVAALQKHQRTHATSSAAVPTPTASALGWCFECTMDFLSEKALAQHYQLSDKHPKCSRCGQGVMNQALLYAHMQMKHQVVHCGACDVAYYVDERQRQFDTSSEHPKCTECKIGFENQQSFSEHQVMKHMYKEIIQCVPCKKVFATAGALQDHYRDMPVHRFCASCVLGFADPEDYDNHMAANHPPTAPASTSSKTSPKIEPVNHPRSPPSTQSSAPTAVVKDETASDSGSSLNQIDLHRCDDCKQNFSSEVHLKQHYRASAKHLTCSRCSEGLRNEAVLNAHMRLFHSVGSCKICNASLYQDEREAHFVKRHRQCHICGQACEDMHLFTQHKESKHPAIRCDSCNISFATRASLQAHYGASASHPHCTRCNIGFVDQAAYKNHMSAEHTPEDQGSSATQSVQSGIISIPSSPSPVLVAEVVSLPSTPLHHRAASLDGFTVPPLLLDTANSVGLDSTHKAPFFRTVSEPGVRSAVSSHLSSPDLSDRDLEYVSVDAPNAIAAIDPTYHGPTEEEINALARHYAAAKIQRAWRQRQQSASFPQEPWNTPSNVFNGPTEDEIVAFSRHRAAMKIQRAWRQRQLLASSGHSPHDAVSTVLRGPTEDEIAAFARRLAAARIQRAWRRRVQPSPVKQYLRNVPSPASRRSSRASVATSIPGSPVTHSSSLSTVFASTEMEEPGMTTRTPSSRGRSTEPYLTPVTSRSRSPHSTLQVPPSADCEPVTPSDITARPGPERIVTHVMRDAPVIGSSHTVEGDIMSSERVKGSRASEGSLHGGTSGTKNTSNYAAHRHPVTAAAKQSMWHCRACRQDPCHEPTTTACGHLFCLNCIVRALATTGQCPSCRRVILVRLHVEDA